MSVKLDKQTMWLNYHHLYYFYVIAKEGGIAKASEKLLVGQPTLSTQLRQLEESLGHPLFERQKKKLVLTEAGKIALEYADEVFRLGGEMVEAINGRFGMNRIHVQIGALDSVPKHILLDMIQRAYQIGNCSVTVFEGRGEELFDELRSHKIDLIISNYPPPVGQQKGIFAKAIGSQEVFVCGATRFKNLKKGFPASLDGQPFVLPTIHSKLRHDLNHYFKLNNIRADIVAETQDTSIQKLLGASGIGLIPLPQAAAEEMVREKKLTNLGRLAEVREEIWLISATRKIENPIAARLMKEFTVA